MIISGYSSTQLMYVYMSQKRNSYTSFFLSFPSTPPLPPFIPFTLTCVMSSWSLQTVMVLMIRPKGVHISVSATAAARAYLICV